MSDSRSSNPPPGVIGQIQPFDPLPSVSAAADALGAQGAEFALIGRLALDAWGISRATKDVDFAVPVGAAEPAAEVLRGPMTELRPLRIGGVGVRDAERGIRVDLVNRRFHFEALFAHAFREAVRSGRKARVAGRDVPTLVERHLDVASANRLDTMARETGRPDVARPRLYRNGEEPE